VIFRFLLDLVILAACLSVKKFSFEKLTENSIEIIISLLKAEAQAISKCYCL